MIAKIKQLFSFRFCLMLAVFCAGMYWTFFEYIQEGLGLLRCFLFWFLFAGLVLRMIHKNKKQVWTILFIVYCWVVMLPFLLIVTETGDSIITILVFVFVFIIFILTIIFTKDKRQLFKGFVYYLALLLGIYISFHICLYAINGIRTRNILEVFVPEQQIREENQNSSNQEPLDEQSIQWHLIDPTTMISKNQVFYSTHYRLGPNFFWVFDKKTAQKQWSLQCGYPLARYGATYIQNYSTPLIFNDTVYFICGFTLYANNRYTGQKKWTFPLTEYKLREEANDFYSVYQPLMMYKNSLYVIDKKLAIVYALDPTKGTIKWQHQFERSVTERLMINNDELIYAYLPFDGEDYVKRYFLDVQTGRINRHDMINYVPDIPYETIDPEVIKKGVHYTTKCSDNKKTIQGNMPVNKLEVQGIQLCAIDIKSGLKLWDYILPNSDRQDSTVKPIRGDRRNIKQVIIDGDLLFMITSYPDLNLNRHRQYELHAFNIKKRIEIWQQPLDEGLLDYFSLLISDHIIYFYNSYPFKNRMIQAFDLETGKELKPLKRDRNIY